MITHYLIGAVGGFASGHVVPALVRLAIVAVKSTPQYRKRDLALRRIKYDILKEQIKERHLGGFAGLIVEDDKYKFDAIDMASFKPPMYGVVMNANNKWCIFWSRKKMIQELGTGAPLREGEVVNPEITNPSEPEKLWQKTPEDVDKQASLTVPAKPPNESGEKV
jgi:hypothetical protein